jgi:small multidrug resistance family-3 protein
MRRAKNLEMMVPTIALYGLAAVAEIAGCFAFFAWWRLGKSVLWLVPGMASLIAFAMLLSLVDSPAAGRIYAAYGGIYIAAALLWLWLAEGLQPDRFDLAGAAICLIGAAVIIAAPR